MAESTGYILAAAGVAVANDVIFAPVAAGQKPLENLNWRIIPATAIAALTLAGLEKISPVLGKGLAVLALLTVLVIPVGNAPSPVENAIKMLRIQVK